MPLGLMRSGLMSLGSPQSGRAGLRRRSGVAGRANGPMSPRGVALRRSAATAARCRATGLLPQTGRISPKFNHIYASLPAFRSAFYRLLVEASKIRSRFAIPAAEKHSFQIVSISNSFGQTVNKM
jgi:hypothetical protein